MSPEERNEEIVTAHPVKGGDIELHGPFPHTPEGFAQAAGASTLPIYFGHGQTSDKATADAIAKAVSAENNSQPSGKK